MVAGPGDDARGQDRRHTLATGPAGRAGNAKSVPCSPGVLADFTVRQFRSVRAAQPYIGPHPHVMRIGHSWRPWNDPRIGEGFWRTGPYLTRADAARRHGIGGSIWRHDPDIR